MARTDIAARVARVVRETRDTVTLVLDGGARDDFRAGQFVTIDPHALPALGARVAALEAAKRRREPVRAYSLSSAPGEPLAITVQEERAPEGAWPPLLSPHLVREVAEGAVLPLRGFFGRYVLPDDAEARAPSVLHLCAGSGIVPSFAILKHALAARPSLTHTLVYSNRDPSSVIFAEPLEALARAFADRLRVVHTFTRAAPAGFRAGRVDRALVDGVVGDRARTLVFACGPQGFVDASLTFVSEIGVPAEHVITEAWG